MTIEAIAIGVLASFLVGISKGGIPGIGNVTVALFAMIFPPQESVGLLLPVLICADIIAVLVYKKHANWTYMKKLFPWTAIGIFGGVFYLKKLQGMENIDLANLQLQRLIGLILVTMTIVHFLKKIRSKSKEPSSNKLIAPLLGGIAGFATMTANAAGPVASIYFLQMKLPKYAFIGTSAWFFFLINVSKVPLMVYTGSITESSIFISLGFGVFAAIGALIAPKIVHLIPSSIFEVLVWTFTSIAGLKLLFS